MTATHAMPPRAASDLELATSILGRMAAELSMIVDREFRIEGVRAERSTERPSGSAVVHISFKLGLEIAGVSRQGCLLVPLPEAIALAAFLMMMPDEDVALERQRSDLDRRLKEALLEVGKLLGAACEAVVRPFLRAESAVRSDGCQGVRAGVRPTLAYREGDPLLVARARGRVHHFDPFELLLVLPAIPGVVAEAISG